MQNIENWTEVTRGIYRYVIGACVCYEIHIVEWQENQPLMQAESLAYVVGEWDYKERGTVFERELLSTTDMKCTLEQCIAMCIKDFETNVGD